MEAEGTRAGIVARDYVHKCDGVVAATVAGGNGIAAAAVSASMALSVPVLEVAC